jgi:uncharacterized membrane protein YfcA
LAWFLYVLIGLASGVISGMGIGGGAILIPALSIFCGMEQQAAQNTNLMYFIPTAAVALISHVKQGNIEKRSLPPVIILGLAGAAAGAFAAVRMDGSLLKKCFGYFLLAMSAYEIFRREKKGGTQNRKNEGMRNA